MVYTQFVQLGGLEIMAWYDEAVFYHIYPLGMTGAPKQNEYGEPGRKR